MYCLNPSDTIETIKPRVQLKQLLTQSYQDVTVQKVLKFIAENV